MNKEYRVKESFIELARAWYDAEVFSLNVKSPSAVNQVNKWISDKTKDFITNPVSGIDPDTIMLIVNTLYFKGAWIDEFNKECTEKEDFTLGTGETVQADMMNGQFRVPYYNAGDFKAANSTTRAEYPCSSCVRKAMSMSLWKVFRRICSLI